MESSFNEKFRIRTKRYALNVIKLFQSLPKTEEARIIGKQILISGTSVAANFRAACRGRSNREYYSKMCIVVEECDETLFWFEILHESGILSSELLVLLEKETLELLSVFSKVKMNLKQE